MILEPTIFPFFSISCPLARSGKKHLSQTRDCERV